MTRRKLVALVAVVVFFAIGLVVFATGLFVTHTDTGRGWVRDFVVPRIAGTVHRGTLYVGKVSGNIISGFTVDSIAIRDERNELFLSTGRVTVAYNWRDVVDLRAYATSATVEHPYVHFVQHKTGKWNFKEIFESPDKGPGKPKDSKARNLGNFIVFDSVRVRNGTFLLTMDWGPDSSLHGAKRDSAIRAHVDNPAKNYTKTFDGYGRIYAWRNANGLVSHIRLADPDSDKFGRVFEIATLSADEYEPTFKFRNVRGKATLQGDTVQFDIPHFDMPASTGDAKGKVWWGSDRPVRYDITIHGDSVALDDVNWVYPTLPRTGGGKLELAIKNDPKNEKIVDFRLQKMDVRSTKSHLTGEMWFGTGAALLLVRNVDLKADPVDFDLIRTLNGKDFPFDWRGQIFGTVKARGGPLTHFYVDDARGTFEDAHVRGAVSQFTGKGELDILYPSFTAFHHFDVTTEKLDLRTFEYLNPGFPRLGGFISGSATLDSSWLDVRFSSARLAFQNGPGEPSRATGSGRVTYGKYLNYDLTLDAQPLNLTMLARSPVMEGLPVKGLFSGPIRVKGILPDLEVAMTLQGALGALSFAGRVDGDSVGGFGAHGHGQFSNVNVAGLLERPAIPAGTLSGHYDVDVAGPTLAMLQGVAEIGIDPTLIDSIRVYPSQARVRFADGRMIIDSLRVRTAAFTAVATGAIGLPKGTVDSLHFTVLTDSLGGWRPVISHPDTVVLGAAGTPPDSISGSLTMTGVATGTLDVLNARGRITGDNLYFKNTRGEALVANFDFTDLFGRRSGTFDARVDSVTAFGIALDTVGGSATFGDSTHARFRLAALFRNGPTAAAAADWIRTGATDTFVVDSLGIVVGSSRWNLEAPTRLAIDSAAIRLDSLVLRNLDSAFIALSANVPDTGSAFARLRAFALPLPDIGRIAQLTDTLFGVANLDASATGTKLHPVIEGNAGLSSVKWSGVDIGRVTATGGYRDSRMTGDADIVRGGKTALTAHASWPYDVTLFGIKPRNDSILAVLRADSAADLSIFAPLLGRSVDSLRGRLLGNVQVSGLPSAKVYNGELAIKDGSAFVRPIGVKVQAINGRFFGGLDATGRDSLNIQLAGRTGTRDSAALVGWVKNVAAKDGKSASFSLAFTADSLHAFNRRSVAELYVSTPEPIRLEGTMNAPTLTGAVNVDRGAIFLADPDIARKLAVEVFADSSTGSSAALTKSSTLTTLLTNLQNPNVSVTLGQDVRLRSAEANVRLAGSLNLVKSTGASRLVASSGQFVPGLTLEGQLTTVSGSYTLNLGIVQREFSVQSGGTVTFDGGPPETPQVDIYAQYNVKQFRDRDLGVVVNLRGRMPKPVLYFSSTAEYAISPSDLISYLIIGRPGFDFGANQNAAQAVASLLSPTISAVAAEGLRPLLGGWVDAFRFELGNYDVGDGSGNYFSSKNITQYLNTATIDFELQVLKTNVFLGVNTGVCELKSGRINGVGVKAEYRFRPDLSFQAAYDPATATRSTCNEQLQQLNLVQSPSQFGFAIRHTWRF